MSSQPPNFPWLRYRRTLEDAYKPRPLIQYIAGNLFPIPSLNIVYGPPGCLKSFLLADLIVNVVAGTDWLQQAPWELRTVNPFPVNQCLAMWIDFDNGQHRTDNRFEALGKAYRMPAGLSPSYYSMPEPALDASKTGQILSLIDLINFETVHLVVIDNLATISGGKDENSSEMITVMTNLRLLAERTGAAVVVIHHSRKENGYKGKQGDNLRGFSGIRGAIDTGLYIEREPNSDTVLITSEKTRDVDIPPFSAQFTYEHKASCNELEEARFYGVLPDLGITDADIETEVFDFLANLPIGQALSQLKLAQAVKKELSDIGINRIKAVITNMAMRHLLGTRQGKRNAIEYFIP